MSRFLSVGAAVVAVVLVALGVMTAALERTDERSRQQGDLVVAADEHTLALQSYFQHARSISLLTASEPAFTSASWPSPRRSS